MGGVKTSFFDYDGFVEKFKPKKTTDDCYTPPLVYAAVRDWVFAHYGLDPATPVVRPFFPGGDFENADYPPGCVVIDNPPFSICAKICRFYCDCKQLYFIFCPGLTAFGLVRSGAGIVTADASITYENGAVVATSFATNLGPFVVETAPDLTRAVREANDAALAERKGKPLPKYVYPDAVLTAARGKWLSAHGADLRIRREDAALIGKLDAQGANGIFGYGLLLSERAAAERAAAERAAAERAAATKWQLSPRELEMQRLLGKQAARVRTLPLFNHSTPPPTQKATA